MKQTEHLFQFSGAKIAAACAAEQAYHQERLDYWRAEQERIVDEAKALTATVKVEEQQVTGGKRYQIVADISGAQTLNWKLGTAGQKIEAHRLKVDEYKLKGAAYATQPERAYELDPADVAYFRLNGGSRDD